MIQKGKFQSKIEYLFRRNPTRIRIMEPICKAPCDFTCCIKEEYDPGFVPYSPHDDLEAVATLGFRGEALASIAAVSRLTLSSNQNGKGYQAESSGRDMQTDVKPVAHPKGSSVEVRDLFFNTPARRKFLRTEKTEFNHLQEVIKRQALSRFAVGFTLRHNGRVIYQLRPANTQNEKEQRLATLCGPAFMQEAVYIENQSTDYTIWGWIGLPSFSRSQADLQHFFVNGRVIKDRLVAHAVKQAYRDVMYHDRHSAFV